MSPLMNFQKNFELSKFEFSNIKKNNIISSKDKENEMQNN